MTRPVTGRYIEPFLGSGAVFFALQPSRAILSDANSELINAYKVVRKAPEKIEQLMQEHQRSHSADYYYRMRDYRPRCEFRQAARFLYLNRTCWNGLYRVNLRGEFNVPIGTKTTVVMPTDDWANVAKVLNAAKLVCGDFENIIDQAEKGDLVFADPPYTVKHNLNGFIKYNNALFSWDDQIRLRDAALRARLRGANVIVTNANHASVRELYKEHFVVETVARSSVLAGSAIHRGRYEELLIR